MEFSIRQMRQPDDYEAVATLLNTVRSEPTTAANLKAEEDQIPPGKLHYDEEGRLRGWDRPKWVAEDGDGAVIGYAIAWRSPWMEPGELMQTVIVSPEHRMNGVGRALHAAADGWAAEVKASRLVDFIRESDGPSVDFAVRRGYVKERHTFESVLDLERYDGSQLFPAILEAERTGIRFITLAEEPGEESERKLYELYKTTHPDIPGFTGGFPWFEEWKKWTLGQPGIRPEWIHIAKDGGRYIGVVTLQQNEKTRAMYHEYTGVLKEYRGRGIALALKLIGIQTAIGCGVPYLRTHNDSLNAPMLHINRDLLGFRAEPGHYKMVRTL